jgi:hypothetical protein
MSNFHIIHMSYLNLDIIRCLNTFFAFEYIRIHTLYFIFSPPPHSLSSKLFFSRYNNNNTHISMIHIRTSAAFNCDYVL